MGSQNGQGRISLLKKVLIILVLFGVTCFLAFALQLEIQAGNNVNLKGNMPATAPQPQQVSIVHPRTISATSVQDQVKTVLPASESKIQPSLPHISVTALPTTQPTLKQPKYRSRNAVLGIAHNVDSPYFAIFAGSLNNVGGAEAFIFMNIPLDPRNREIAERFHVNIIEYNQTALTPKFLRHYHPSTLRWIFFNEFLQTNREEFDRVLFVDVRDTFFQQPPFDKFPALSESFHAFGENLGMSISSCDWNRGWVKDCFENALERISSRPVICSGLSLATMDKALVYVEKMSSIVSGSGEFKSKFPRCERNGVDQGVHNVLMHFGFTSNISIDFEPTAVFTNMQSSQTVAYVPLRNSVDKRVVLMTDPPFEFAVVHQYDRIHEIQAVLLKKYVYWLKFDSTAKEMWDSEQSCQAYHYVPNRDLMAGKCDCGHARAILPVSCCKMCSDRQRAGIICSGFAFSDGVCYFKECSKQELHSLSQVQVMNSFRNDNLMSAYI